VLLSGKATVFDFHFTETAENVELAITFATSGILFSGNFEDGRIMEISNENYCSDRDTFICFPEEHMPQRVSGR
jgi:hypothetical protein